MPRPPDPAVLQRPWVTGYPPGVPPTYELPKVTLARFVEDAARDFSDRPALVTPRLTLSHGELRDRVEAVTTVLVEHGLVAGDRVLVALPNHATAAVALFAVWRLGAIVVPVAPTAPVDRLAEVVADAGPRGVLAPSQTLAALAGQPDLLPEVAVSVDGREWEAAGRLARVRGLRGRRARRVLEEATEGPLTLGALLAELGDHRSVPPGPVPDDPAVLAYRPEGPRPPAAVLTHANLVANAFQARLWVPDVQAGRERLLVADPLRDPLAMTPGLLTGILAAATVVLLDDPDPGELAAAIDREQPTLLIARPERLVRLLAEAPGRRDLTSLRVCLALGAPLGPDVAARFEGRTAGARLREAFGLREAGPLTHAQPVYGRVVPGSLGLPVTETVAVVVDEDDRATPVPTGDPGLLLVAGPQVADGYWARPEETAATFVDGWVATGDVVTVDEEGVFHHVGRADQLVRREGTLVAPRRVEAVLERHADVQRAGVAALDGPALVAVVARRRRHRLVVDDLLAHCRAHLDPPAVPDRIEVVDEVPTTPTGEIARDELMRRLTGGTT